MASNVNELDKLEQLIRSRMNRQSAARAQAFMMQRKRARIAGAVLSLITVGICK